MTPKARLTNDWLPLPEAVLRQLHWDEGVQLDLEIVSGTLLVTKSEVQQNPLKPGVMVKKRALKA